MLQSFHQKFSYFSLAFQLLSLNEFLNFAIWVIDNQNITKSIKQQAFIWVLGLSFSILFHALKLFQHFNISAVFNNIPYNSRNRIFRKTYKLKIDVLEKIKWKTHIMTLRRLWRCLKSCGTVNVRATKFDDKNFIDFQDWTEWLLTFCFLSKQFKLF